MTSPVSIPAGHKLIAADFDPYEALTGAWTAYTPVWTAASVNPVIGNGTITGSYVQAGKFVSAVFKITMGSTTTFGTGTYSVSLPVTAVASVRAVGALYILDAGTANRSGIALTNTTSSVQMVTSADGDVGPTVPQTFAVNDIIMCSITYEAA